MLTPGLTQNLGRLTQELTHRPCFILCSWFGSADADSWQGKTGRGDTDIRPDMEGGRDEDKWPGKAGRGDTDARPLLTRGLRAAYARQGQHALMSFFNLLIEKCKTSCDNQKNIPGDLSFLFVQLVFLYVLEIFSYLCVNK